MSKGSKKGTRKSEPASQPAAPARPVASATPAMAGAAAAAATADPGASWLDSSDPRRRLIGKVVFVAVWVYVAALWLLALDQTFNWGIFGPKIPPLP